MEESTRSGVAVASDPEKDPDLRWCEIIPVHVLERERNSRDQQEVIDVRRPEGATTGETAGINTTSKANLTHGHRDNIELHLCHGCQSRLEREE
jgi:hypothetical protein